MAENTEEKTRYFYDEEHDIGYYWGSVKTEIIVGEKLAREKDQIGVELPMESVLNFVMASNIPEYVLDTVFASASRSHLEELKGQINEELKKWEEREIKNLFKPLRNLLTAAEILDQSSDHPADKDDVEHFLDCCKEARRVLADVEGRRRLNERTGKNKG